MPILATRILYIRNNGQENYRKKSEAHSRGGCPIHALFMRKAARYKAVSAMIRDAVRQFDDTATHGKVKALKEMTALYRQYQQELSWLGGNFNQTVKRANELAIAEELTPQFFEQTLYPQVAEIQKLINSIKGELHDIAKEVSKL